MASLSPAGDALTIRLVYDGPPESGKTSSLRTLAGSLARRMESPEEAGGRTLFFDWVEYIGGSFEGLPIRCQIVSVPGQRALASRRRMLLAGADAIVFVADSTRDRFPESEAALAALRAELENGGPPHPGIVVQANKRDVPEALPAEDLRSHLEIPGVALIESVAIAGTGIREAFVLAVRLALDRVRDLRSSRALIVGRPEVENAGELLYRLRSAEAGAAPLGERRSGSRVEEGELDGPFTALGVAPGTAPDVTSGKSPGQLLGDGSLAGDALREVVEEETRSETAPVPSGATGVPMLPNSAVPSGRVWPPIEGRTLLHAASAIPAVPRLRPDGSWGAMEQGWWFHSAPEHEFRQLDTGKAELLRWAQLHARGLARLSPQRCLVLSESSAGTWRLWQIVRPQPALRQKLTTAFRESDAEGLARALLSVADGALQARRVFAVEPALPCLLEVIGEGGPDYVGLLPTPQWTPPSGEREEGNEIFLRRLLGPSIRRGVAEDALDVPRVLNALGEATGSSGERRRIVETLKALLIGH